MKSRYCVICFYLFLNNLLLTIFMSLNVLSYLMCDNFIVFYKCSEVTQSCLTLCDPLDGSPTRFLHPWDFSGKNTGVGCHLLLQGIFPTQGLNPGLLHCRQTPYPLSYQEHIEVHIYILIYILI